MGMNFKSTELKANRGYEMKVYMKCQRQIVFSRSVRVSRISELGVDPV